MAVGLYNALGKVSQSPFQGQVSGVQNSKSGIGQGSNVFADMINNLTDMAAKSEESSIKTALGSGNYIESLNYVQQLELSTKALSATSEKFINAYNNVLNILK